MIHLKWVFFVNFVHFLGISKTGSGKTLAFLVPALMFLIESDTEYFQNGSLYPAVLIVAPTRELALQINEVVESFEICNSVCVYGGSARSDQMYKIKKNKPPVIIGTPGRINDFIDSNLIDLSNVCYLGKLSVFIILKFQIFFSL